MVISFDELMPTPAVCLDTCVSIATPEALCESGGGDGRYMGNEARSRTGSVTNHQIPKLTPTYMWPRRHAKVAEAHAALGRIDYVEFTHTKKVHGVQVFVLSVYLKRQPSRIPTNRSSTVARSSRHGRAPAEADFQLEKRFRDLQMLRYHSWVHAQRAQKTSCDYCDAFHALTQSKYSHTKLTTLLWPSASNRKKVVEGFVNSMVDLSVHGLTSLQRSHRCEGFENIPVRVARFLLRH